MDEQLQQVSEGVDLTTTLNTYGIPAIVGLIIMVLIQLVKSDRIPVNIPAKWRPAVALIGGLGAMIATRLIQGEEVRKAIFDGVAGGIGAGLGAVGLFEVGLKPKSAPPPAPPPAPPSDTERPTDPPAATPPDPPVASRVLWITDPFLFGGPVRVVFGMLFALLAFGCADTQRIVRLSSEIIARAEPCLMAQYEAQQEACLELHTDAERRGCVADVKALWSPIIDGLVELRTVRCEIEPAKCEAEK